MKIQIQDNQRPTRKLLVCIYQDILHRTTESHNSHIGRWLRKRSMGYGIKYKILWSRLKRKQFFSELIQVLWFLNIFLSNVTFVIRLSVPCKFILTNFQYEVMNKIFDHQKAWVRSIRYHVLNDVVAIGAEG